jgi:hypothetical protein
LVDWGGSMITVQEVKDRLGVPANDTLEDDAISNALTAATSYLGHVRPDRDWTAPDAHERAGVVWLTIAVFQEKGRIDSSVDAFTASITPVIGRQAAQMLGIDQYYPPVVA